MIGKQLQNARNNIWLNFALPTNEFAASVDSIRQGKALPAQDKNKPKKPDNPLTLARLGIVLVPNVLERTPPFVDIVRPASAAAHAGVRPDDLILLVDSRVVQSCAALQTELAEREADSEVRLTLMRGTELVEVQMKAADSNSQ